MSNETVKKALGSWLQKAPTLAEPPKPTEVRGTLQIPERPTDIADDAIVQLNFKVSMAMKKRIKQLAVRDNVTLLAMLDEMVALYEREYGRLP